MPRYYAVEVTTEDSFYIRVEQDQRVLSLVKKDLLRELQDNNAQIVRCTVGQVDAENVQDAIHEVRSGRLQPDPAAQRTTLPRPALPRTVAASPAESCHHFAFNQPEAKGKITVGTDCWGLHVKIAGIGNNERNDVVAAFDFYHPAQAAEDVDDDIRGNPVLHIYDPRWDEAVAHVVLSPEGTVVWFDSRVRRLTPPRTRGPLDYYVAYGLNPLGQTSDDTTEEP
jgi:hypothetical protein